MKKEPIDIELTDKKNDLEIMKMQSTLNNQV